MKHKTILITLVLLLTISITLIYNNTKTGEVILSQSSSNFTTTNEIAIYIQNDDEEYVSASEIPSTGYILNKSNSYCKVGDEIDSNVSFSYSNGYATVLINQNGTKCYLYFDISTGITVDDIINSKTIDTRTDFTSSFTDDTTGTLYTTEDDYGTSYYYAGAVSDNYVYFAGYYWRIIRFNGDGSTRLIYQGTTATDTGQITTSAYNTSYNNNAYLGYMYTTGSIHGYGTSSTIKGVLEDWYENNLLTYKDYISYEAGFCNDRTNSTSSTGAPDDSGGTGTTASYYGTRYRMFVINTPSLICSTTEDLFTTSSSSKGNKALTYPIGLLTGDEASFAGAIFSTSSSYSNTSYYLYTGYNYWIMSPSYFSSSTAYSFNVSTTGRVYRTQTSTVLGVRPVINLSSSVTFTEDSDGTSTNPYTVVTS